VVVATHDRAKLLPRFVDAMAEQIEQRFELVIVDDGSTDDTAIVLKTLAAEATFPVVPIVLPENRGPAKARNDGWRAAQAPLVAFTDDDCVPEPGWLAALGRGLERADIVQGRTIPNPAQLATAGPFSRIVAVDEPNWRFETCNVAYRRDVLVKVGGFDESFAYASIRRGRRGPIFGEDVDLAWRARELGASTAFERDAVVLHDVPRSRFRARLREARRTEGMPRLLRRHSELRQHLHWRWFYLSTHPPALLAAAGLCLSLRRRASPATRVAGILMWMPYADSRTHRVPLWTRRRSQLVLLPVALVADLYEIGVLSRASLRERCLLL